MTDFNNVLENIGPPIQEEKLPEQFEQRPSMDQSIHHQPSDEVRDPFDVKKFIDELAERSEAKNKAYSELAQSINAYAISSDCISNVVKRILGYPVKSFGQVWLPVLLRSTIGTAIHEFIQGYSNQFTEIERTVKIPSIRFSGRLDGLIGRNVMCEIKSVTHKDYKDILNTQKPRTEDFYQAMTYKYVLENYLDEIKNPGAAIRTPPPALDKYEIDTIQLIYVAHDISASDCENFGQAIQLMKEVKQKLNSKFNQFYFITTVVLKLDTFDPQPYLDYIRRKIDAINYYVDNNKLPGIDDEFVDTKKCFFCLYRPTCELKK